MYVYIYIYISICFCTSTCVHTGVDIARTHLAHICVYTYTTSARADGSRRIDGPSETHGSTAPRSHAVALAPYARAARYAGCFSGGAAGAEAEAEGGEGTRGERGEREEGRGRERKEQGGRVESEEEIVGEAEIQLLLG